MSVEAASPALIEKVRAVVTDSDGRYQIVDLRPGVYKVTFMLPGFNTVVRDALELPANFTAQVNVELRVGALEESITVSGQSPVVDVQSAVQQVVLTRAVLDAVPSGRSVPSLGALMPGARLALPDVGGTSGMQNRDLTVHGSDGRDTTFQVDGMTLNGLEGDGSVQSYFNDLMFEEISYQSSAITAEVSGGGVRANMIPKDGGNSFRGTAFFSGANGSLQADNSADARAQGLTAPDALNKVWDLNVSLGGPIKKNRLWFFSSYRDWGVYQYIANSFFGWGPKGPNFPGTTPSADQAIDDASLRSGVVRLTSQFGKHKIAGYLDRIRKFRGHENSAGAGVVIAGEATDIRAPKQYYTAEGKWTASMSSHLLLEAGFAINNESYSLTPQPGSEDVVPKRDITLNTLYGAYDGGVYYREPIRRFGMVTMSYVTGSHAMKTGVQFQNGYFWRQRRETADLVQRYTTGFAETYDPNFYDTDTRTWADTNGNNFAEASELGPSQNRNFGVKASRRPADDIARPYQIETNVSLQREVVSGTSVTFSYFRRDYKNLIWTDNLDVGPSDHTAFQVPSPRGDGESVTIYNLSPAKLGIVDTLDQNSTSNSRKYNGVDVSFNSRMRGLTLFGGVSLGKQVANTCEVQDPNAARYCDQAEYGIPYQTQVKLSGSYTLPRDLQSADRRAADPDASDRSAQRARNRVSGSPQPAGHSVQAGFPRQEPR